MKCPGKRKNRINKMITQAELKSQLHYDHDTGVFTWINPRSNRMKAGDVAGRVNNDGHIGIRVNYKRYSAHRLAWLYVNGELPKNFIDHIDGNPSNNKLANLRECTNAENQQNRISSKGSSSKYLGVKWSSVAKKWQSTISINGKQKYLGLFIDEESASVAYCDAKKSLHTFNPIVRG